MKFKIFFISISILLFIFSVERVLFFFFQHALFSQIPFWNIVQAFLYGLRFDLSVIFLVNAVFIFLFFLPGYLLNFRFYRFWMWFIFWLVNLSCILLNVIDLEFYSFTHKRMTADIFAIQKDVIQQLFQLAGNYWHLLVIFILIILLMVFLFNRFLPAVSVTAYRTRGKQKILTELVTLIFMMSVTFLFSRGGWQYKPIHPTHAYKIQPVQLGTLVLNSSFTFLHTLEQPAIQKLKYFPEGEAQKMIKKEFITHHPLKNENVVLIIMEGISPEYKEFTPFLDSLAKHSLSFENAFSAGTRSIEALPSLLAGIPDLMDEPYITSPYHLNKIAGLGSMLSEAGYHTSFFHGGRNGTMLFDNFSDMCGIEHYYGLNEYTGNKNDFDGTWGIYDEPFLQFTADKLDHFKPPFFSTIFLLSSHQPFTLPELYRENLIPDKPPVYRAIRYSDLSLRNFFNTLKNKPWFTNTLFIITADHSQLHEDPYYRTAHGIFRVPLLLYKPGYSWSDTISRTQIVQHKDLMVSLLDYLGINPDKRKYSLNSFGVSVFDNSQKKFAITYQEGLYQFIQYPYLSLFTHENPYGLFNIVTDPLMKINLLEKEKKKAEELTKKTQAYIQYFNNGLIGNAW